jgi:hypothetical protein
MKKYNFKALLFVLSALLAIFLYSCDSSGSRTGAETNEELKTEISITDISGTYKMPENTCGFELTVTKEKDDYSYNIKSKNGIVDIFGKLTVSNESGTNYVNFTLPESFSEKTAQGLLENNTITIQNYGNAENQFTIFEDCDDKYMVFKKN